MSIDLIVMKRRLEDKRVELQRGIARLTETPSYPPEDTIQSSDGSVEIEEQAADLQASDLEQSIQENEQGLLVEVQQALERIAKGTYGICTNCGQPIPEKRLEALPWASLCITCESKLANQNQA
ncbi:MAG TPA: TraR/DksA C4-type zinc finger protein [Ktedonobacteraceae bacterium]|nr:TraR/DksA C4-type zinc finger protein [Ktedonobacteraceae bacterium]